MKRLPLTNEQAAILFSVLQGEQDRIEDFVQSGKVTSDAQDTVLRTRLYEIDRMLNALAAMAGGKRNMT